MRNNVAGLMFGLLGCLAPSWGLAADAASGPDEDVAESAGSDASFSLDAVFATRSAGNGTIIEDTVTGDPVLTGDDLAFGWAPGVDARMNAETGEMGVHFRFLGGLSFSAAAELVTPAIWNLPTNPPLFGLGVADIAADYDSSLNALELNLSKPLGAGTVFAGLRGLGLNEDLTAHADFGGNEATIAFGADTIGLGPQVGGQIRFGDQNFIEVDGRVAAMLTKTELGFSVEQNIGPGFGADGDQWGWAAVAEAGMTAGMKVGPASAVRLGYRAVYVYNVPTALSSVGAVDLLAGSIGRTGDSFLAHGVTLGFESDF